jgi:hypothetical protein
MLACLRARCNHQNKETRTRNSKIPKSGKRQARNLLEKGPVRPLYLKISCDHFLRSSVQFTVHVLSFNLIRQITSAVDTASLNSHSKRRCCTVTDVLTRCSCVVEPV